MGYEFTRQSDAAPAWTIAQVVSIKLDIPTNDPGGVLRLMTITYDLGNDEDGTFDVVKPGQVLTVGTAGSGAELETIAAHLSDEVVTRETRVDNLLRAAYEMITEATRVPAGGNIR